MSTAAPAMAPMLKTEYEKLPSWNRLTAQQKLWVETFLQSQDAARSTKAAYGVENSPYASMLCRKIETSFAVIEFLNEALRRDEHEKFIQQLQAQIRRAKSDVARAELLKLYAKVAGLASEIPETVPALSSVRARSRKNREPRPEPTVDSSGYGD